MWYSTATPIKFQVSTESATCIFYTKNDEITHFKVLASQIFAALSLKFGTLLRLMATYLHIKFQVSTVSATGSFYTKNAEVTLFLIIAPLFLDNVATHFKKVPGGTTMRPHQVDELCLRRELCFRTLQNNLHDEVPFKGLMDEYKRG